MRKLILTLALAGLAVIPAMAQDDLILEEKDPAVSFDPPFYQNDNEKPPVLTVKASYSLSLGYSHLFNAPAEVNASGFGLDWDIVSLHIKPGRNAHTISIGLLDLAFNVHSLKKDYAFDDHSGFIARPESWKKSTANLAEFDINFPIGYLYDSKQVSFGLWASPGVGFNSFQNTFREDGFRHRNTYGNRSSFRLNVKAAIWYRNLGIFAQYYPLAYTPKGTSYASYTALTAGISLKF